MEHTIKVYPVGNADCILVKLGNDRTVIIDCQIKSDLTDGKGTQIMFDVKADLLKELGRDSKKHPYVDLYISTHPHDDHCTGFGENFYHGNIEDYDDKKDKDKIIIGELWITSMGMGNDVCDAAADIRREAKRRRELYDQSKTYKGGYGNYLHIIGYDKDKEYDERYGYIPGSTISSVNGSLLNWLKIFIHAPFKDDISTAKRDDDKNATSIVAQFKFSTPEKTDVCKVIFGGDAEHEIWQHILDNNGNDEDLEWNIFVAPHHCSWTFFNESSNKDVVLQSAEDIISLQIGEKSVVVASSNEIKDDDNNPPCFKAMQEYKKRLKDFGKFYNTAVYNVINKIPQPVVFKINKNGKRPLTITSSAQESIVSRPAPRAGIL